MIIFYDVIYKLRFKPPMKKISALFLISIVFALSACSTHNFLFRDEVAQRIASPAWLLKRVIPANEFALTAYERIHERSDVANVYIEGDGQAWLSRTRQSGDPTPVNPVALHMASKDNAKNVIYLARPCQYSKTINDDTPCHRDYWSTKRFSPEVIESYVAALDNIKAHHNIMGLSLIHI